ncbi:GILT protein C02D5.2-like [Tropilaelaps mercedesae]|uniref:GILT protein C02D5.2-like n=1 Tax=Tropilaelaps mercedesae TaxID=418985 RepID=A0A1V9X7Y2_9ACAR|nr:GILT protein C02D5.2-like [Tropilaelaps mercedesae]
MSSIVVVVGTLAVLCASAFMGGVSATTNVTIYYETLCPDSQKLLVQQVIRAQNRFGSSVKFDLVPYGFAEYRLNNGELSFKCQHGPNECKGNMLHACAISYYPSQSEDVVRFAACTMRHGTRLLDFIDECAMIHQLSASVLRECATTKKGRELLRKMGDETNAAAAKLFPNTRRFKFIPSTFIDGNAHVQDSIDDLPATICLAAVEKPKQCTS